MGSDPSALKPHSHHTQILSHPIIPCPPFPSLSEDKVGGGRWLTPHTLLSLEGFQEAESIQLPSLEEKEYVHVGLQGLVGK